MEQKKLIRNWAADKPTSEEVVATLYVELVNIQGYTFDMQEKIRESSKKAMKLLKEVSEYLEFLEGEVNEPNL